MNLYFQIVHAFWLGESVRLNGQMLSNPGIREGILRLNWQCPTFFLGIKFLQIFCSLQPIFHTSCV